MNGTISGMVFNYERYLAEQEALARQARELEARKAERAEQAAARKAGVTVHFTGGPWDGKTTVVKTVTAPVFAAGDNVGNHYFLDTESDPPVFHWDGTGWEISGSGGEDSGTDAGTDGT